uniref:Uncharacterized protein n=1 Tax=Opuntia streptacantha TaxID=393608 RepID=A0A7C8ZVK9_OPUST
MRQLYMSLHKHECNQYVTALTSQPSKCMILRSLKAHVTFPPCRTTDPDHLYEGRSLYLPCVCRLHSRQTSMFQVPLEGLSDALLQLLRVSLVKAYSLEKPTKLMLNFTDWRTSIDSER